MIDRIEGDHFIGRTEYDSPEVDNEVLIGASEHYARIGDFREVEIINAEAYDLFCSTNRLIILDGTEINF